MEDAANLERNKMISATQTFAKQFEEILTEWKLSREDSFTYLCITPVENIEEKRLALINEHKA